MSLRKCFAQQNLELSLFFVFFFLGRKELLFVKTYLFPNWNAVRSEYQNVVQNSQKGTWSKTPAYSYACTVHELKGKPSSFLFYFAGQPQDPRVPVVLHRMWWIGKCWELWITREGISHTIPLGGEGTFLYLPYRYVPLQRVGVLRRFGRKTGIDFAYSGLNSGMVFEGMHERICRLNSKWIRKKE